MMFLLSVRPYRNTGAGHGQIAPTVQVAPYCRVNYAENSLLCARPMASPLQRALNSREDGLGRIAGQLVRVKRRLNLLAAQQMAFSTLGLLVGAGGILVIAAFFLSTAHFLTLGLVLLVLLAVSLPFAITRAVR